ncbi:hypothetical protein BG011_000249 [Mortierella polycephala]|uniref:DNA/RNA-binding protein Alba-like domain-containing protein n=1 Tax=Mortierella polycephala TaxID=41804 RepID=A0A9P6QBC7_9FUNG|nr:hypothetical protein BG011_000249 [Mortierella polycephala]
MENYHRRPKSTKPKFENEDGAGTQEHHNRPQQHGVMVISPNGKIRSYVSRALEVLMEVDTPEKSQETTTTTTASQEASSSKEDQKTRPKNQSIPSSSTTPTTGKGSIPSPESLSSSKKQQPRGVLTIKAQGRSITKAVTVAEILKRRMEGALHQFTEIGLATEQEIWDPNPDKPNLDPLTVSRHRPTIRIRLSKYLDDNGDGSKTTSGLDTTMPGASIPRDEHANEESDEDEDDSGEQWPGAILDRDAAARKFVGYQPPTGNDIYL